MKGEERQPSPWHYESALADVEAAIEAIESGQLDLAEVVQRFDAAVATLQQCQQFVAQKRSQVGLIIEQLASSPGGEAISPDSRSIEPDEDSSDDDLEF